MGKADPKEVFFYDETSKEVELTASKVSVASVLDGWQITVTAADANSVSYSLLMEIESESIDGTFTYNNGLSAWSKVERGQSSSYVASGATLTINKKSNGNYTISGNLLCENEMTYILKPFDFSYTATGIEAYPAYLFISFTAFFITAEFRFLYILYEG